MVLLLLAGLFAVAAGRAAVSCRKELHAAEGFLASGDLASALLAARHAAEWYVPLDGCSEVGLTLLDEVAAKADATGQGELALVALRSARTSIMLTRGLYTPHAGRLPRLHAEIAARMAAERRLSGKAQPDDQARYLAQLDGYEARRPNPWLALAGSLGFVGWLGAVAGFAWFGLRADGSFVWKAALGWAGTALVLFCLWLTLVRYA
ncbi:MAG: hypothetical protein HQ461_14520 [Deltaproteobacteria bacterium]|nr:hypothetical protein [Deltaproteobacteria bacterium]